MKRTRLKRKGKTPKQTAWDACSLYIRLRDAIKYCERMGIFIGDMQPKDLPVQCCTCDAIKPWPRMDAGHCFPRGHGGSSGTYFDERNLAAQCGDCNSNEQGNQARFIRYLEAKYDKETVQLLEAKHHAGGSYPEPVAIAYRKLYEKMYQDLLTEHF